MADSRPDHRSAREAIASDMPDRDGDPQQLTMFGLTVRTRLTGRSRKAFDDAATAKPSNAVGMVARLSAANIVEMDELAAGVGKAYQQLDALLAVDPLSMTKEQAAAHADQIRRAQLRYDLARQRLGDVRRTKTAAATLNAQLLAAAKLGHDCDIDGKIASVDVTGVEAAKDALLADDPPPTLQ